MGVGSHPDGRPQPGYLGFFLYFSLNWDRTA